MRLGRKPLPQTDHERFMQAIIDAIPDPLFVKDSQHRWRAGNVAFWNMIGGAAKDFLGKSDTDLFPSDQVAIFWEKDSIVLNHGISQTNEETITRPDGGTLIASTTKAPMTMPNGEPALVGVIRDITELKRKEQALEWHYGRLEELVNEQTKALRRQTTIFALLRHVAEIANRTSDPSEAIAEVLPLACDFTRASVAHVWVRDGDRRHLVSGNVCHVGVPEKYRAFMRRTSEMEFPAGFGLPGGVLESERASWIANLWTDESFQRTQVAMECGLQSGVAFPVMVDATVYAVMELFFSDQREPCSETIEVLGEVGRLLGVVFERWIRERSLQDAKDAAERANRVKSEFLANMSHELRTPLHAILGFSRQAHKRLGQDGDTAAIAMLSNIQASGHRLLDLVNDLLDASKLEAGRMEFDLVQVPLVDTLARTLAEMDALLKARRIRVVLRNDAQDTVVPHCQARMMQVFVNLLSNAIKFSPEGSQITIGFTDHSQDEGGDAGSLCMTVEDEGVGIPPEELEKVFDQFAQSSVTKSGAGGTGLGLSIVRGIVRHHGGRIHAENRPEGGTRFVLRLPRKNSARIVEGGDEW